MSDTPVLRHVSGKITMEQDVFILLDYMPPYPLKDTEPQKVVVWSRSCNAFIRDFKAGPIWDVYGDDLETVERAEALIDLAPEPQKPYKEFKIKLDPKPK